MFLNNIFRKRGKEAELPLPSTPFGYKPPLVPTTLESRYSHAVIEDFVRTYFRIEKTDPFAQAHAEDIYAYSIDYIKHLPPYRQVLLLDGDRPTGKKRSVSFGESHIIRRRSATGIYDYWCDDLYIKVQKFRDGDPEGKETPILRSKDEIQNTISHETSHREDNQLLRHEARTQMDPWCISKKWEEAVIQQFASGNVGMSLQALLPDTEINMQYPYYQNPVESKAEIEKLFCLAYRKLDGDFAAANQAMESVFPNMWPVFRDEYITLATKTAASLNPHIDLDAKPIGFGNNAISAPKRAVPSAKMAL